MVNVAKPSIGPLFEINQGAEHGTGDHHEYLPTMPESAGRGLDSSISSFNEKDFANVRIYSLRFVYRQLSFE